MEKYLKTLAIINLGCSAILALICLSVSVFSDAIAFILAITWVIYGVISFILIAAFAELLENIKAIRKNTSKNSNVYSAEELPRI